LFLREDQEGQVDLKRKFQVEIIPSSTRSMEGGKQGQVKYRRATDGLSSMITGNEGQVKYHRATDGLSSMMAEIGKRRLVPEPPPEV
jgi:hypothetical protein